MHKIVEIANGFIGQTEKPGNSGFKDPAFEKLMRGVGFYKGAAWCGFFARLVWQIAGQDISLLSGSVKNTWIRAKKSGNWHTTAVPGAVVVYRSFKNGQPLDTGHMGIVYAVDAGRYSTIEGNTSAAGSREGTIVGKRFGKEYNWHENNGLRLMGFIHPK